MQIDAEEYERRRLFCDVIRRLNKSEHIEIARILRRHDIQYSENRSGIFFDMAKLPQTVVNELVQFHEFVSQNEAELTRRQSKASAQVVQ
jgi:hypothetical protein